MLSRVLLSTLYSATNLFVAILCLAGKGSWRVFVYLGSRYPIIKTRPLEGFDPTPLQQIPNPLASNDGGDVFSDCATMSVDSSAIQALTSSSRKVLVYLRGIEVMLGIRLLHGRHQSLNYGTYHELQGPSHQPTRAVVGGAQVASHALDHKKTAARQHLITKSLQILHSIMEQCPSRT